MLILALLAGAAAFPTAAGAAVAQIREDCFDAYDCDDYLYFDALPGEANVLSVSLERDGRWRFRDEGAPLQAGNGCTPVDEREALCWPDDANEPPILLLGDGDDTLRTDAAKGVFAVGGPGADRLAGGPAEDSLHGSSGRDDLSGGAGDDRLGDDEVEPVVSGDRFDGGEGDDSVDYDGRRRSVTVDLERRVGGALGERDDLVSIEGGADGRGDDRLLGSAGGDTFVTSRGDNVVLGRGGDDYVAASSTGHDRVEGGAGDDEVALDEESRAGARVTCGAGRDIVERPTGDDLVLGACERVRSPFSSLSAALRRSHVRVRAECEEPGRCVAVLRLRAGGRVIARRRVTVRSKRAGIVLHAPLRRRTRVTFLGRIAGGRPGDGVAFRTVLRP